MVLYSSFCLTYIFCFLCLSDASLLLPPPPPPLYLMLFYLFSQSAPLSLHLLFSIFTPHPPSLSNCFTLSHTLALFLSLHLSPYPHSLRLPPYFSLSPSLFPNPHCTQTPRLPSFTPPNPPQGQTVIRCRNFKTFPLFLMPSLFHCILIDCDHTHQMEGQPYHWFSVHVFRKFPRPSKCFEITQLITTVHFVCI